MWRSVRQFAPVVLIALIAVACSRDGGSFFGRGPGQDAGGPKTLSVWIIPDEPTAADELLAVVSGAGGDVVYGWEVNGRESAGAASERFASSELSAGDRVTVTALSGGQKASGTVMVRNAPPMITGVRITPEPPRAGSDITAVLEAGDPDGDHVRFGFKWLVNGAEEVSAAGAVLPAGAFRRGDEISLRVTPFDGVAFGKTFLASVVIPNAAPGFTSMPPSAFKGRVYSYTARAEDPDGDALKYSLLDGPKGMEMDASGRITWRIGPGDDGVHRVEVAATDGMGQRATQSYEIAIELDGR